MKTWQKAFLVQWFVLILVYEKVLRKMKPLFDKKNEELHKKYPGFRRDDKKYFKSRLWNYIGLATWLPRFGITVFGWIFQGICALILMIGLKKDKNGSPLEVKGIRYALMRIIQWICCRLVFVGPCCVWVKPVRNKICYKKYLGKDWKPDYDGFAGSMVANHTCFLDPFVHGMFQQMAFLGFKKALNFPLIREIAQINQGLIIPTLKTSEDRKQLQDDIIERQRLAEKGKAVEMCIHAEGCTTNGKMIGFKRGAFMGLHSIRPKGIWYNNFGCQTNLSSGIIDYGSHFILAGSGCLFQILEVYEMPIFRPNDYFFETHQKEDEEKWQTYARVIRDIIHEGSGGRIEIVRKSDGTEIDAREKQEYKDLLWPPRKKKEDVKKE